MPIGAAYNIKPPAPRRRLRTGSLGGLPSIGNFRARDAFPGATRAGSLMRPRPIAPAVRSAAQQSWQRAVLSGGGLGLGGYMPPVPHDYLRSFNANLIPRSPQDYRSFSVQPSEAAAADRFRGALELTPEAYKFLDPEVAAYLQTTSDMEARQNAAERARQALDVAQQDLDQTGTVGQRALEQLTELAKTGGGVEALPPVPTPPDIASLMGKPGFDEAYWQRRKQSAIGDVARRFAMRREMLRRRGRNMSRSVYENELRELEDEEQQAGLRAIAEMENERDQVEERGRLARVDRLSQLYGTYAPLEVRRGIAGAELGLRGRQLAQQGLTSAAEIGTRSDISRAGQELTRRGMVADLLTTRWPQEAESWTSIEDYLRGARYADEAANIGRTMANAPIPGGGGGFAGTSGLLPEELPRPPEYGGIVATPRRSDAQGFRIAPRRRRRVKRPRRKTYRGFSPNRVFNWGLSRGRSPVPESPEG